MYIAAVKENNKKAFTKEAKPRKSYSTVLYGQIL